VPLEPDVPDDPLVPLVPEVPLEPLVPEEPFKPLKTHEIVNAPLPAKDPLAANGKSTAISV